MFKCKLMQLFFMKLQLGPQTVIIRRIKFHCFIRTLPIACNKTARKRQRTLHCREEIRNFSSSVEKYSTSEHSKRVKYFLTREEKFLSLIHI